jgi:hypothetical protein
VEYKLDGEFIPLRRGIMEHLPRMSKAEVHLFIYYLCQAVHADKATRGWIAGIVPREIASVRAVSHVLHWGFDCISKARRDLVTRKFIQVTKDGDVKIPKFKKISCREGVPETGTVGVPETGTGVPKTGTNCSRNRNTTPPQNDPLTLYSPPSLLNSHIREREGEGASRPSLSPSCEAEKISQALKNLHDGEYQYITAKWIGKYSASRIMRAIETADAANESFDSMQTVIKKVAYYLRTLPDEEKNIMNDDAMWDRVFKGGKNRE